MKDRETRSFIKLTHPVLVQATSSSTCWWFQRAACLLTLGMSLKVCDRGKAHPTLAKMGVLARTYVLLFIRLLAKPIALATPELDYLDRWQNTLCFYTSSVMHAKYGLYDRYWMWTSMHHDWRLGCGSFDCNTQRGLQSCKSRQPPMSTRGAVMLLKDHCSPEERYQRPNLKQSSYPHVNTSPAFNMHAKIGFS